MTRVRLIAKPGCHLCDLAREQLSAECEALGQGWEEVSILEDETLAEAYWELIPVVLVDGERVCHWFLDVPALLAALEVSK